MVCYWEAPTERNFRASSGGDEYDRAASRQPAAGVRTKPGRQCRTVEPSGHRTQTALGIMDAHGRGFLCAPHRRDERRKPVAGAGRRPRKRNRDSIGARSQPRADRPPTARRKPDSGRHIGTAGTTCSLGGHPPHSGPPAWRPGTSKSGRHRPARSWLGPGPLPPRGNTGWTRARDHYGTWYLERLRAGSRTKHFGSVRQGRNSPRFGRDGIRAVHHSPGRRWPLHPKPVVS